MEQQHIKYVFLTKWSSYSKVSIQFLNIIKPWVHNEWTFWCQACLKKTLLFCFFISFSVNKNEWLQNAN